MNKSSLARLEKLEGTDAASRWTIVWMEPDEEAEAEAEAARLAKDGSRVILIGWACRKGLYDTRFGLETTSQTLRDENAVQYPVSVSGDGEWSL